MVKPGVMRVGRSSRRQPSVGSRVMMSPIRPVLTHCQVLLQRMPEVDVAGERVDLLAVDEICTRVIAGRFTVSALTIA